MVTGRDDFRSMVRKTDRVLEIGPYHSGLFRKQDGYNTVIYDVFTREELLENARTIHVVPPDLIARIEEVDIVGSAVAVGDEVERRFGAGHFDFVVSCHNLEHIPDPIRFLQGCHQALRPSGRVLLALPDLRNCYDYFRPISTTAQWIEAHVERRERPTAKQVFEHNSLHTVLHGQPAWFPGRVLQAVEPLETVETAFHDWKQRIATGDERYVDCHCWTFCPASFQLLILDCRQLGLIRYAVESISTPVSGEILATLCDAGEEPLDRASYYSRRRDLLRAMKRELASDVA